jgi:hypothetical protein
MAVVKNNSSNNDREKVNYKWGNSGPNYWQRENKTALLASMRKSDKNFYELVLKIQSLDDDGKFVKNEDGTYDNGYFNFSAAEVARVRYQLEQMFPTTNMDEGTIGGIIVNHISAQSNNGSQFEIVAEEDGVFMYISYVQNAEVTAEYKHLLSNDQTLRFYDENGEESEEIINMDIVSIKELFSSAYALVSGLVDSVFEANNFNINGKTESKTGGKVAGGLNRKVRSTLGSKRTESISEDDEDDVEVAPKKTTRKPSSSLTRASNMKSLLNDDDEEDD